MSTNANNGLWTRQNRRNAQQKSIIDYILTDEKTTQQIEEMIVDEQGALRLKGNNETDHNTIAATIELRTKTEQTKVLKWNKATKENWNKYNEEMVKVAHLINNYNDLEYHIIKIMETTIGSKTINTTQDNRHESQQTKHLRQEKKLAKNAYKKAIRQGQPHIMKEKMNDYMNKQKNLKEQIEEEETNRTKKIAEKLIKEGGTKSQMFWKIRKLILGKNTKDTYDVLDENNEPIEDPEMAREHIAKFFENLYQAREGTSEYQAWTDRIKNKVQEIDKITKTANKPDRITMEEVNTAIKHLKAKKAHGPDRIPNEALKYASNETRNTYLNIFNQITETAIIPEQWKEGEIIRLYKGKGKKGLCANERGITLASNMGKLYERIINNRIMNKINITEAQAGGKKGQSTTDHLLRLKDTAQFVKNKNKEAFIVFLDVTKAYDKAWIDAIMYIMNKEGTPIELWKIIKEMNKKLTATIKTKHGNTRKIQIKDSIRQGGILPVIQYSLMMDEINKEMEQKNIGPKMNNINVPIGCLLWMDDVALIAENRTQLQQMLDITHDIASRYHIEFGDEKSKILKIGKPKQKPDLKLGTKILKYTDKYKYLGETINNKLNLKDHIQELKGKTEAAFQTILSVMGNNTFHNIELEVAWKLLETCVQPIITYAGETWKTTKLEMEKINQIQEQIIKRILMTPQSTPKEPIYTETGLLDINTIVKRKRIKYQKKRNEVPLTMTTKIMNNNTKGGWKETTTKMYQENEDPLETFKEAIQERAATKTKAKYTMNNTTWEPGKRKPYMNKLNRLDASTIFKTRTRMLDVKENFRGKYNQPTCRLCNEHLETQEHILEHCTKIHTHENDMITPTKIFDENTENLKTIAQKIRTIMNQLNV